MKKKILLSALVLITHVFSGCTQNKPVLKNQYLLKPYMVINETGCGYGTNIADEQSSANPETFWNGHDKDFCKQFQPSVILNLLQKISITDVYIFSREDAEAIISAGPKKSGNQPSKLKKGWNKIAMNTSSGFLNIYLVKGSMISEVLVDAGQKYSLPLTKTVVQKKIPFNEFIGTNAFVDVPLGLLEPFGCIREYHDWPDWNEPQKDSFHLAVSKQGFDFENFYQNLNKAGKTVVPTLQKSPKWLTGEANVNYKPLAKGSDALNPISYSRHALFLNKYAANFSQAGKGNVQYFENWNEPDKWWESGNSYFTPYQYASMSSADKDGHQQKMGPAKGMNTPGGKNKLVMAGMANPKIDYLHALKHWCDMNRKGNFAWDVINYHRYSNSSGLPDHQPKEGICPEMGNVYHEAREIINFRDKFLPDVQVWITEFGYDTEDSPQQCKPIGQKTSELVQADWLLRSYLLLSAAGVEKAFQYMIRDFAKTGLYATSGLYSTTLREKPFIRPSWNYINTLKCALQDCYFEKLEVDSSTKIYTAVYANKNAAEIKTKVIWLGTQDGGSKEYEIKDNDQLNAVAFSADKPCGDKTNIANKLKITETPVIIQSQRSNVSKPCYSLNAITTSDIQCKFSNGTPVSTLTDEQKNTDSFIFGLNSPVPVSVWKTDYTNKASNGIVFYLNSLKNIHSLQLFDGAGSGEIEISAKSGNDWIIYGRLNMNPYNKWRTVVINSEVKEIKIEKLKGSPDIGEIIIYEKVNY